MKDDRNEQILDKLDLSNLTQDEKQFLMDKLSSRFDSEYWHFLKVVNLIGLISTRIMGRIDEAEIYRTVIESFNLAEEKYIVAILLLDDNGKRLKIEEIAIDIEVNNTFEKVIGQSLKKIQIKIGSSNIFSDIIKKEETKMVFIEDFLTEFKKEAFSNKIKTIIGNDIKNVILAPIKQKNKTIGIFFIAFPYLTQYLLPSIKNLSNIVSDALELCHDQKTRIRTEVAFIKEKVYLKISHDVSLILGTSGDFDEAARVMREGLNLSGVFIVFIDKVSEIARMRGSSVSMPEVSEEIIKKIQIDLNKNKSANEYFNKLELFKTISLKEILKDLLLKEPSLEKIISPITDTLLKANVGDILIGPLVSSYNTKIGVLILAKKNMEKIFSDELPLINSLANTLAISLENQLHQKKLVQQIIFNKLRADIWKISSGKILSESELIKQLLERVGSAIGVSRACYNEYTSENLDSADLKCVIEWCAEGVIPSIRSVIPSWFISKFINVKDNTESQVYVINFEFIQENLNAEDKAKIEPLLSYFTDTLNIESMLIISHFVNKKMCGVFLYEVCKGTIPKPVWNDYFKSIIFETAMITSNYISQKKSDEALRLSEEKFRTFMETASDLMYITNQDGYIMYVNKAMSDVLGYSMDELLKYHCTQLLMEESQKDFLFAYDQLVMKGEMSAEVIWLTKNRKKIYGEIKVVAIYDNQNNFIGSRCIFRDITERKQIEEERKRFEANLRHFQKMETIGRLAGGIAHDFNNILSPIMGYTEMALEDVPENSYLKTSLKRVYDAAKRAKGLVQQILTFSKQSSDNPRPVNIAPIIRELLNLIRSTIPTNIKIKENINIKDDLILIDPSQVFRLLMNLCTNSQQAMEGRGGILEVSLSSTIVDAKTLKGIPNLHVGQYIRLDVSDTGCGMDNLVLERIFEPYFTTKEIGKGTGMGLYVVHGIVKNNNGAITVESSPGKGTAFHIYFPKAKGKERIIKIKEDVPLGEKEHILFIDDEREIVFMVKQMLERLGYEVTAIQNSVEALKLFSEKSKDFNLVITDQSMPEMTGTTLIAEIKSIRPDIPIILTTGYSKTVSMKKSKEMGIEEYLMKPISKGELGRAIQRALNKNKKLHKENN